MQTFLPYKSFQKSAKVLDNKRLGKQRIEAAQILATLGVKVVKVNGDLYKPTHKNHPCVKMWKGYEDALKSYYNCIVKEWIDRGFKNNMILFEVNEYTLPSFIGKKVFHDSHKSNLLRKKPDYYYKYNWNVPDNLEYSWS